MQTKPMPKVGRWLERTSGQGLKQHHGFTAALGANGCCPALLVMYGTFSSVIILAPGGKWSVFLKEGVRHNRYPGYESHLTFSSAGGSIKDKLKLDEKRGQGRGWFHSPEIQVGQKPFMQWMK